MALGSKEVRVVVFLHMLPKAGHAAPEVIGVHEQNVKKNLLT